MSIPSNVGWVTRSVSGIGGIILRTNWQLVSDSDTEDLNCGDTGYVWQGRRRVNGTTTPCLGEDNFYAFSAIVMKVGPGLDIVQFSRDHCSHNLNGSKLP